MRRGRGIGGGGGKKMRREEGKKKRGGRRGREREEIKKNISDEIKAKIRTSTNSTFHPFSLSPDPFQRTQFITVFFIH